MLISVLLAAALSGQAPPPSSKGDRASQKTERELIQRQLASRSADPRPRPAQTGAEATAVMAQYLRSIGKQLQPPDSYGAQSGGSSGSH